MSGYAGPVEQCQREVHDTHDPDGPLWQWCRHDACVAVRNLAAELDDQDHAEYAGWGDS